MLKMLNWLDENFTSFQPNRDIALKAARHLSKMERKKLFSSDIEPMRTAEGRWYEAIIYETMLKVSLQSDLIKDIVRKGADARYVRGKVELGQNGLFYSKLGDINIRGNGQDLAEVDLLLVDKNNAVAFAEIVTSPLDMKDFEEEIQYKKRLLGHLFGQETVPFLLISSVDISRVSVVRRIVKEPDNALLSTLSCGEIKSLFSQADIRNVPRKPIHHPKLVLAPDLMQARHFDYKRLHDQAREKVISAVTGKRPLPDFQNSSFGHQLVKKILFGALYPSAVKLLCQEYTLTVKGQEYDLGALATDFSKVVLAVDLPEYEPIVYLRSKKKKEYFKMVKDKTGNFKFERYTPSKVGFFLWLESVKPNLGARITKDLLDTFMK
jgi:hypothetical protein